MLEVEQEISYVSRVSMNYDFPPTKSSRVHKKYENCF